MNKGKILAGVDAGHINTKAVIIRGEEILGYCTVPTGFDVVAAAQSALNDASDRAGIPRGELGGIVATGIFRDMVKVPPLNVTTTVPDYMADAKGALFLNKNSRTVIDIGGNIHKAIRYDQNGNLQDVIQNDKCADGMGIFYTTIAKAMGLSEREMSELALKSTGNLSIAIQCALSAESDAIDLMCQGADIAEVADAISRFIVERVADMCTTMNLSKEIVVAGGLAKSQAIIKHLASLIKQDLNELNMSGRTKQKPRGIDLRGTRTQTGATILSRHAMQPSLIRTVTVGFGVTPNPARHPRSRAVPPIGNFTLPRRLAIICCDDNYNTFPINPLGLKLFQLAGRHEHDALADVGHAVADALQVVRHPQQVGGPADVARVFEHVGQQFAEHLLVQAVHLVVARGHLLSRVRVKGHKGVERGVDHLRATCAMIGRSISGLSSGSW